MDPAVILDWYRADPWPRMRRVLIAGPSLLSLGGLVVAVSFATREPRDVRAAAAVIGLALVASGAGLTLAGMFHILRDDAYLAIRTDGVAFRSPAGEMLLAWSDLARARWDDRRVELVLERKEGEPVVVARPFARIGGPELAGKIELARRRESLGMLGR
ncbi:MAG TPA: PH domain-containing protein [Polyangiaceae bacterium]|jgi:hypothetical protein|nr:PH domain-containing protein [Polyangiaceae bacterium]